MDVRNLAARYDLAPLSWESIRAGLDAGLDQAPGAGGPDRHTCWLTTLDADGGPHLTAVGALWVEGRFWFETGPATRKARNLARDPRCTLAVAMLEFDLVVAGTATRVDETATVAARAADWAAGGWPAQVDETGTALTAPYSAPSAGAPPWWVYRVDARTATAVGTVLPGGATRWTF